MSLEDIVLSTKNYDMDTSTIDLTFATELLRLPYSQVWSDYDEDADVLYLSFEKPQCANGLWFGSLKFLSERVREGKIFIAISLR